MRKINKSIVSYKLLGAVAISASMLFLAGCASNATISGMTYHGPISQNKVLKENIGISNVKGGFETSSMGRSQINNKNLNKALKNSLIASKLYDSSGKYVLSSKIEKMDQPYAGIDMTVLMSVLYHLEDKSTHKQVFHRTIKSKYTATMGDAFVGTTRLRLANEGAAKNNIKQLIEALNDLKIKGADIKI